MGNCLNCGLPVRNIANRCYICRRARDKALSDFTCKERAEQYKEGFGILMEYWDSLPDEEKEDINERLKEVGL